MLPKDLILLKLVWHPDDQQGGEVKPTAFRKVDLCGRPGHHVSVDRSDRARKASMLALAERQALKADGRQIIREEPFIGRLNCGAVHQVTVDDVAILQVTPYVLPDNDAHCGIENVSGERNPDSKKERAFFDEVRGKLARLASPAVTMDEAFDGVQPTTPIER